MPREAHLPRSPLNAVRPPLKTRVTEELPGRPRLVVVRLWWTPHRGEVRPALVLAVRSRGDSRRVGRPRAQEADLARARRRPYPRPDAARIEASGAGLVVGLLD